MNEEAKARSQEERTKQVATPEVDKETLPSPQEVPITERIEPALKITIEKSEDKKETQVDKKELSKGALTVLTLADIIYRNKGILQFTVFDVKAFVEEIHPDIDPDATWSELREKGLVPKTRDFEQFILNYQGQEEISKHRELLVPELLEVFKDAQPSLLQDESLQRLLLLGYLNEYKAREFLTSLAKGLDPAKRIVPVFFLDKEFCQLQQVEKIARKLVKEYPPKLAETARSLSRNSSFFLGLASLRTQELKERFGLSVIASAYHPPFTNNLRLLLGDEQASEVIRDLLHLGLTGTENIFGLNLDSILLEGENLSRVRSLLSTDPQKISNMLKSSWRLFNSLKGITQGNITYLAESDLVALLRMNALTISKEYLLVSSTLAQAWQKINLSIRKIIEEKLSGIDNAVFLPLYDSSQLRDRSGYVVVTLEGDVLGDEVLQRNVVVRLSPVEAGFPSDRTQNEEYNALGEIKNLSKLKSIFVKCKWVSPQNPYVERAKAIIEENKTEKITLEEAIRRLGTNDFRAVEMLSLIADKYTSRTAIDRGYFTNQQMWDDVSRVMQVRHNISNEEFEKLRQCITGLVENGARTNLIYFSDREGITYSLFSEKFESEIVKRTLALDENQKKALYVFLKNPVESGYELKDERWLTKFGILYTLMFNESCKVDLSGLLVSVGLANESTWITSQGNSNGPSLNIVRYFATLKPRLANNLDAQLRSAKPDLEEFRNKLGLNVPMLAGLEHILMMGGYVERNKLRDYLWSISLAAWKEFRDYPALVSSKENNVIGVNPLYYEEIRRFVREGKKKLLESNQELIDVVRNLKNIDNMIALNEESNFFEGSLVTPEKEEFRVIISPWFLPSLSDRLGIRSLLILTNQENEPILQLLRASLREAIVVTKAGEKNLNIAITESRTSLEGDLVSVLKARDFSVSIKEERIKKPGELLIQKAEPLEESPRIIEEAKAEISPTPPSTEAPFASLDDALFEPNDDEEYAFSSVISSVSERPICIVAERSPEDEYVHTLQLICRELYRIKSHGLPRSTVVTEDRRQIEEELDASKKIFVVDDSRQNFFEFFKIQTEDEMDQRVTPEKVEQRLRELFSQGYGYVIFYVDASKRMLLQQLLLKVKHVIPELKFVRLRKLSEEEKRRISSVAWGLVEPQVLGTKLDYFFGNSEKEFYTKLRRVASLAKYQPLVRESLEDEEGLGTESSLHYSLKSFVIHFLTERAEPKIPLHGIQTEVQLEEGGQKVVPDIFIPSMNTVVEIETLYGTGMAHIRKLARTIEKYQGKRIVWLVVPNLQIMLFRRQIRELLRQYNQRIPLELFAIDVKQNRLIPFQELARYP